jgi:signal transduction histidine kinase
MDFSHIIQGLPSFLIDHRGAISLLSSVVSLLFALVVLSLSRRFKVLEEEPWVRRFAWAFFVLAIMFSIRFLVWLLLALGQSNPPRYVAYTVAVIVAICSSLSNYFFFGVGFPLARKSRRLRDGIIQLLHITPKVGKYLVYGILFGVALISAIDVLKDVLWARIPDVFLSALALVFVGTALYRNISFRRGPFMARLALVTAIGYAFLHLSYGFHPLIAHQGWADWLVGSQETLENKIIKMDLIVFSVALVLKLGLFFPAYTLMLMIATPTGEVRRLLKRVTHESADFLDDYGVVRSISEEIQASRVELYIKLPGTERDTVGRYTYPPKVGVTKRPEEIPFDRRTDYGYVMATGEDLLFRLVNYSDQVPDYLRGKLSAYSSVIAMPVFFHKGVIGCLKAELDDGKFTEADMQNIQRCAALVSPAVQDYREVDALNEISYHLTRLQIETIGYDIQEGANRIAKIAQDILAPLATGVSIEAGFRRYMAFLPENDHHGAMMKQQLHAPYNENIFTSESENLRWLPKKLKITSHELMKRADATSNESISSDGADGEQFLGKLLLATYEKWNKTIPPTLATNFFHRRVVSNLITEVLLNFVRGYLNEVTKQLGISLSGLSEANVAHWFESAAVGARNANLLWAVATQPNSEELLGQETALVQYLEKNGEWEKKNTRDQDTSNLEVWLCTLKPGQRETSHVIRILLGETGQTIWLGVANPQFALELDYLSPWAAFILRFGEIADSALQRILSKQERENLEKEAADFHGLATAAITTGTVIHQMVNQVRDLTSPITTLENAIRFRTLVGNEIHRTLILSLRKSANQIEELTKLFSGVTKPDDRRPCSLYEAVQYAFNLLRDSFTRFNIEIDQQVPPELIVDVPFYVAAFSIANLLNNAKDAIRDGKVRAGVIQIKAEVDGEKMIFCHVTDNGSGVPARLIDQLFKSSGKSQKPHGSGLGLYLSARSLREARGDIRLTHPGPEPQTTFTICFPKQRQDWIQ